MTIQHCGLILPHPWVGEIDTAIVQGLAANGCQAHIFQPETSWDFETCDFILTYGPMEPLQGTISRLKGLSYPPLVIWFTEQPPWPRSPDRLLYLAAQARYAWQALLTTRRFSRLLSYLPKVVAAILSRGGRLRALGEMLALHQAGLPLLICVFTATNQNFLRRFNLPATLIPMGWAPAFGYPLFFLPRDIDVVFLGSTRDRRRKRIIARLEKQLSERRISFVIKDGSPQRGFAFGQERTILLNRTKIMLNIMRQPWDDPVFRLLLAAPTGAMVLSETLRAGSTGPFQIGQHFAMADLETMVEAISYYLQHEDDRQYIADCAFHYVTHDLTMGKMVQRMLNALDQNP